MCFLFHHCLEVFIFKSLEKKSGREVGQNKKSWEGNWQEVGNTWEGSKQRNELTAAPENKFRHADTRRLITLSFDLWMSRSGHTNLHWTEV